MIERAENLLDEHINDIQATPHKGEYTPQEDGDEEIGNVVVYRLENTENAPTIRSARRFNSLTYGIIAIAEERAGAFDLALKLHDKLTKNGWRCNLSGEGSLVELSSYGVELFAIYNNNSR